MKPHSAGRINQLCHASSAARRTKHLVVEVGLEKSDSNRKNDIRDISILCHPEASLGRRISVDTYDALHGCGFSITDCFRKTQTRKRRSTLHTEILRPPAADSG